MASAELTGSFGEHARRFWRWWTGELRECVPQALIRWSSSVSVLPLVVPETNGYSIHRFDGNAWRRVGDAIGATPEALAKSLGGRLQALNARRFMLALMPGQYLSKIVHLPAAAEDNLRNALRYELDRHTPFKPEDVGFDCAVVGRDEASREIAVRLVISPKANIAQAVERVAASGALVAGVQPAFVERSSLRLNLLPHDDTGSTPLERLAQWAPWALLAALGAAALVLPVYQKRAQVIELQPQVNIAGQQAQAADALHQQLDRAQNEYNFVLQKRYASPTTLQLLNEVTRILPDDTWLQNFELRTTAKGKELQLQGETGVAGKLIELFEQSPLLTGASFKSPVTQAPGSQGSRFHLGIEVKEGAPPSSAAAAANVPPPNEATAASGTPSSPPAGAPTTTTTTTTTNAAATNVTPSAATTGGVAAKSPAPGVAPDSTAVAASAPTAPAQAAPPATNPGTAPSPVSTKPAVAQARAPKSAPAMPGESK